MYTYPVLGLIAILFLLILTGYYLNNRLLKQLHLKPIFTKLSRALLILSLIVGSGGPLTVFFVRRQLVDYEFFSSIQFFCYLVMGFMVLTLTFVIILDVSEYLLCLILKLVRKLTLPPVLSSFIQNRAPFFQKRPFNSRVIRSRLKSALILTCAVICTGTGYIFSRHPVINEVHLPIPNLPPELSGTRIVVISDLHTGMDYKKDFIESAVTRINELKPDMFAILGDIADGIAPELIGEISELTKIEAPLGRFYVLGNHEYYWGAEAWLTLMRQVHYQVLFNSHVVVRKGMAAMVIGGVPDLQGERFLPDHKVDLEKTFQGAPKDKNSFQILLVHQPKIAENAEAAGVRLQLSGHTHGGQFFPINYLIYFFQKYIKGTFDVGQMKLFVTTGIAGWGPPLRLGPRGEIALLILESQ